MTAVDNDSPTPEIIYVGDPMCSWCWGIAPELDELVERRPDIPMRLVVGGLRPGPGAEPMSDRMAEVLAHHWHQVTGRSGQPFDHGILERRDWVYDTEPACRAVVTMRNLDESKAWPLFKRIQRAFYAEGVVVSDPSVYPDLVAELDVDGQEFIDAFNTEASLKATWSDFSLARGWGISGFPTVFVRDGNRGQVIGAGYTTADDMEIGLSMALSPTGEAACAPGEIC